MARLACAHCGQPLDDDEHFCGYCGNPALPAPASTSTPAGHSARGGQSEMPPPPPFPASTGTPEPQGQAPAAPRKRGNWLLCAGAGLGLILICGVCLGAAALAPSITSIWPSLGSAGVTPIVEIEAFQEQTAAGSVTETDDFLRDVSIEVRENENGVQEYVYSATVSVPEPETKALSKNYLSVFATDGAGGRMV